MAPKSKSQRASGFGCRVYALGFRVERVKDGTDHKDSSWPFRVWDCNLPVGNKRKVMWNGRVGGFNLVDRAYGLWTREITADCFLVYWDSFEKHLYSE